MSKICVLISSHSPSFFTKMTVKSLLRENKEHELDIHIGYHSNLSDYTDDFSMFDELKNVCHFHAVDEIDWFKHDTNIYRYSLMHSKNLSNLLKNIKYLDFDYVAILDNDLYFKKDFMSNLLSKNLNTDLIGCFHNDIDYNIKVKDEYNNITEFAPKISVWHMIMSRKLYDIIIQDLKIIEPQFINNIFYDTFANVLNIQNINKSIISNEEMQDLVKHFWCSSFNYGLVLNKKSLEEPINVYIKEFGNKNHFIKLNDKYINNNKNLVLGAAFGYEIEDVKNFILSFRKFNLKDDICLLVDPYISSSLENFYKENKVTILKISIDDEYKNINKNNIRYLYYNEYLNNNLYNNILLSDVRDVIFQENIFNSIEEFGSYIYFFEEEKNIGYSEANFYWIKSLYNEEILQNLKNQKIICSGTTIGSSDNIITYINYMVDNILKFRESHYSYINIEPIDQAIHIHLRYYFPNIFNNLIIKENGDMVGTIRLNPIEDFDLKHLNKGRNIKFKNKIPPIIHQYDGFGKIENFINSQYTTPLDSYFDKIFYINLDKRPDRNDKCLKEFNKFKFKAERISAMDGDNLEINKNIKFKVPNVGLTMTHIKILKESIKNNYNSILILEDDVKFNEDFNLKFDNFYNQTPEDWDILYIGSNNLTSGCKINNNIYKCGLTYTMHCIALKNTVYNKLLNRLKNIDNPTDVIINELFDEFKAYYFSPSLATQRKDYSDIEKEWVDYSNLICNV